MTITVVTTGSAGGMDNDNQSLSSTVTRRTGMGARNNKDNTVGRRALSSPITLCQSRISRVPARNICFRKFRTNFGYRFLRGSSIGNNCFRTFVFELSILTRIVVGKHLLPEVPLLRY